MKKCGSVSIDVYEKKYVYSFSRTGCVSAERIAVFSCFDGEEAIREEYF